MQFGRITCMYLEILPRFSANNGVFFILKLKRWTVNKQMKFEGGFQGRTNKLVDGCYSFWCAAILPIAQAIISKKGTSNGCR